MPSSSLSSTFRWSQKSNVRVGVHLHRQLTLIDGKLEGQFICIHDGPAKWRYDRDGKIKMTKQAA